MSKLSGKKEKKEVATASAVSLKEEKNPRYRLRKGKRGKKEKSYFFVAGGW